MKTTLIILMLLIAGIYWFGVIAPVMLFIGFWVGYGFMRSTKDHLCAQQAKYIQAQQIQIKAKEELIVVLQDKLSGVYHA